MFLTTKPTCSDHPRQGTFCTKVAFFHVDKKPQNQKTLARQSPRIFYVCPDENDRCSCTRQLWMYVPTPQYVHSKYDLLEACPVMRAGTEPCRLGICSPGLCKQVSRGAPSKLCWKSSGYARLCSGSSRHRRGEQVL